MNKYNLLYDAQIFEQQRFGGISRYFVEIMKEIKRGQNFRVKVVAKHANNYYLNMYLKKRNGNSEFLSWAWRRNHSNEQCVRNMVNTNKVDVLHSTYYNPYFLELRGCKNVVTIHDMIPEMIPDIYGVSTRLCDNKKKIIYGADAIIAVSEKTRIDILTLYPDINPDKIHVIYHANSLFETEEYFHKELPKEYVLFVGKRGGYKNFNALVEAVEGLKDAGVHVVCAGGGSFSSLEKSVLYRKGVIDLFHQMDVEDEELAYLYQHAICFVYPSKYEGFGIPILEAFYWGCPVILSNIECFREVAMDAAMYFEKNNVRELEDLLHGCINDKMLCDRYRDKGRKREKKFSWEMSAKATEEVYKSVL